MDYKQQSLLYLCYVVMHSDGVIQNQEDRVLKNIIEFERVSEDSLAEFNKDIQKKSLEELRKIGMDGLINASRKDQIKTFAWIYKMIYADDEVNVKEAQFLMNTIKPTNISYSEIEKVAKELPQIV